MEDSDSTKTQTFKDLSPAAFEKCLQLLKGPSDEERFTGLLIVSKAIRPDDLEKIRKVFDTIGFNFINRLVSSKQEDATSYKQLALNILASFCSVPELAQSPEILNKSSFFLDMIEANDDQHAIEDSFMCLASILVSEIGKLSVFQCVNHGVKSISKGITKITDPVQQLPKRLQALNQVVMFTRDNIRNFAEISQLAKDCALCIPTLSKIFKENQDQLKFDILDSLLVILSCTKDVPYENLVRSSDTWSEEIRLGLFDILASKVSEKQRNPALILTSLMIQVNDPQWSLGKKNSKGSEGVFLDLVIRLCRIEVQLILERPEIQKDTITLLSSCYSIIETAISHLSSGAWNCLSRERLQRLQESFTDIFTIVIQYLNYCKKINAKSDGLGLLSLRVLGVWLSEETSLLQKEVFEILPFVIQMEPDSSSELTTDPFPILLPALLNLTSEKPALDIFLSNKGHERLFDYLNKNCLNLINSIVKPRKDDTQTNQNYSLISSALGMVLNIISIESSSKINFNSLISLLPCFVSSMESLVNKAEKTEDGDSLYLLANFVTISLSVLRKYDQEKLSLNNKQEILAKLFLSIISFYKIPNITSSESVADLWFMSLYGLAECIGLYPLLVTTIVSGNLISAFSSYLLQMSEISQDELGVWNNIFINLSNKAPQAKNQLKSNGGMQICQRYGFKQLEQLLRTA